MANRIFFENLNYAGEFLRFLAEHPEIAERIPDNALILFYPEETFSDLGGTNKHILNSARAYQNRIPTVVKVRRTTRPGWQYDFSIEPQEELAAGKTLKDLTMKIKEKVELGEYVRIELTKVPWVQLLTNSTVGEHSANATQYFGAPPLFAKPQIQSSSPLAGKRAQ